MTPQLLPEKTADLSSIQKGWLTMSDKRNETFDNLQKNELAVQSELKELEKDQDLKSVQEKLSKAKGLAKEGKEMRLHFTNMLKEKIIDKSMEFEKRNEELIAKCGKHEFTLREKEAEKNEEANKKTKEATDFKTHFLNENHRVATEYRNTLRRRIAFYYKGLMGQDRLNEQDLKNYIQDIKNELAQIEVEQLKSFKRNLLSEKEAKEIYKSISPYNNKDDLKTIQDEVDEAFAMYEEDIQNAEKAAEAMQKQTEALEEKENDNLKVEQSTNNLIAAAEPLVMMGGAKIKKNLVVEEENTQQWAVSVMTEYIKRINDCKISVKEWKNLKIDQMASALGKLATETGLKFTGLKLKEVKK